MEFPTVGFHYATISTNNAASQLDPYILEWQLWTSEIWQPTEKKPPKVIDSMLILFIW